MITNELLELIERSQQKDGEALEQCVLQNTGLVWSLVHRFHYTKQDPQDLFQIGCIGLMKAILNYDSRYEVMFSTYAVPMILGEIKKFFREDGNIRISRSIKERYLVILKHKEIYQQMYQREPTIQELANDLQVEEVDIIMSIEANQHLFSLDEPYLQKDGSSIRLEDKIESESVNLIDHITLKKEVHKLSEKEQQLLYLRFELSLNQQEIAQRMQMTQVQVSRLEKKIIQKLKDKML